MQQLKFLKHNVYQRISASNVLTRAGDLIRDNLNSVMSSMYDPSRNLVIKGGKFTVDTGWNFHVDAGSFYQQSKNVNTAWIISQILQKNLSVSPSTAQDRYDLVQARYVVNDTNLQSVDIIDPGTGQISQQNFNIDRAVDLEVQIKEGTPGAGVAPSLDGGAAASITGTPVLTPTVDLSVRYNLKIAVDNGAFVTVDCRGATPAATTIAEIITKINTAVGLSIASNDGSGHLKLTSLTNGEDSYLTIAPPTTVDAINILLGLSIVPNYYYTYQGLRPFFKLGEVKIQASSANLIQGDLRDIDSVLSWTVDQNATQRTMSVYDLQITGIPQQVVMLQNQIVDPGCPNNSPVWYNTTASRWEKASAANLPIAFYPGVGKIIFEGSFTAASGLTIGPMYMDPNGNIIQTKTTVKIGFATSATACVIKVDNIGTVEYDIVISTQAEMDYYFPWNGGVELTFSNKSVLIKSDPPDGVTSSGNWNPSFRWRSGKKAYELRCRLVLGSFTKIHGEGFDQTMVVPYVVNPTTYSYIKTYRESAVIFLQHQGAQPKYSYTVQGGSAQWKRGGYLNLAKIISDNGSSTLLVDSYLGPGFPQAYVSTEQVDIRGITFDGCGGVGGPNQYDGGVNYKNLQKFFNLQWLVNSNIDVDFKNFWCESNVLTTEITPAFYMYLCRDIKIGRIHDNYTKASGAGSSVAGGGAHFSNCIDVDIDSIYGNMAISVDTVTTSRGGGAYLTSCRDIRIRSVVGNNVTMSGGGIYLVGCENFRIDSIRYCNALTGAGGSMFSFGGGMYSDNNSNNIRVGAIYSCYSAYTAGGATIDGKNCSIDKIESCWSEVVAGAAQISGAFNEATAISCYVASGDCGGIYIGGGSNHKVKAIGCYTVAGTANGGGIVFVPGASKCDMTADSCYAVSPGVGGGIYGNSVGVGQTVGHKLLARNCYTLGNSGGGIYLNIVCVSCTFEVINCYVNNSASPATASGGGIYLTSPSTGVGENNNIKAQGCYITPSNNQAHYGAGVFILKNKSFDITANSCSITASAGSTGITSFGGGIYVGATCSLFDVKASNCFITGHTSATLNGGGIYINTNISPCDSVVEAQDCYISHATAAATNLSGGGIYITNLTSSLDSIAKRCYVASSFTVSGSGVGGGIYTNSPNIKILAENCYVSVPFDSRGGGAYLDTNASDCLAITERCYCTVSTGGSQSLGGGIFLASGVSRLVLEYCSGCYVTGNNVAAGGGIYSAGNNLNMLLQNLSNCSCLGGAGTKQGGAAWLGTGSLYNIFEGQWNANVATTGPNIYTQTASSSTGTRQMVWGGTNINYDGGFAAANQYPF